MLLASIVEKLPALNAILNGASGLAVIAAFVCIKQHRETAHRRLMLLAVALSAAFLVSYVAYHTSGQSRKFEVVGIIRTAYLVMLASHVILAALIVPLVLVTVWRGLRGDRTRHRRIARWTLPIWLYVSATGVLVYLSVHVWQ